MDVNKNGLNLTSDNPKHWTKQIKSSIVCKDKHGSLNLILFGGACEASFPYISSIDQKKIKYGHKSVKLNEGDLVLEVGGEGVGGCTLDDVIELISRLPTQVPMKTVPAVIFNKNLSLYLNERFSKNSADHCLQQTIRRNIYKRALPCTTRPPREDEVDGVDYKFLTVEEFYLLEEGGRLLEKGKYEGNFYGTLKPQIVASSSNIANTTAAVTNHVIPWAGLPEHLYSMVKTSKPSNSKIQQFNKQQPPHHTQQQHPHQQHSQHPHQHSQHQHLNDIKVSSPPSSNTFSIRPHPPPLPKHINHTKPDSDSSSSPPLPPYTTSSPPCSSFNQLTSNMGRLMVSGQVNKSSDTAILNSDKVTGAIDCSNANSQNTTSITLVSNNKTPTTQHATNLHGHNNNTTFTNNKTTFSNNNTTFTNKNTNINTYNSHNGTNINTYNGTNNNTHNGTYTPTKSSSSSPFSTGSINTVILAHPPSSQTGFSSLKEPSNHHRLDTDEIKKQSSLAIFNTAITDADNLKSLDNTNDTLDNINLDNLNNLENNNLDNANNIFDNKKLANLNNNITNNSHINSHETSLENLNSEGLNAENLFKQKNKDIQQQPPNQLISNNTHTTDLPQQLIHTTLVKGHTGLGFTIIGVEDDESEGVWLVVKNVTPEGPAALDAKLKRGDVLVSVNHREVCGLTHEDVVSMFKGIEVNDSVNLEVVRGHYSTLNFDLLEAVQEKDDSLEVVTTMAVGADGEEEEEEVVVLEEVVVVVVKGATGFGFTLADRIGGQKVKQIVDTERCRGLRQGDLLIQINSLSLVGLPHLAVVDLLKSLPIGSSARFLLRRKASSKSTSNSKSNSGNNTHNNSTSSSTLNLNNFPNSFLPPCNRQKKTNKKMQLPLQHCYHENNHTQQQHILNNNHPQQQQHLFNNNQQLLQQHNNLFQPSLQTPDFIPDIAFKDPHVLDVISNTNNNNTNNNINTNNNNTNNYNNQISLPQQHFFSTQQHLFNTTYNPSNNDNYNHNNLNNNNHNNLNNNIYNHNIYNHNNLNNNIYNHNNLNNNIYNHNNLNNNIHVNNPHHTITQVLLKKSQHGFGFRIIGGREENTQVSIGLIVPGGPADVSGVMKLGQEILFIDQKCVMGAWHKDVVDLVLMASKVGTVQLGLSNTIYPESFLLDHLNNNTSHHPPCHHDTDVHNHVVEVVLTRRHDEGFGFYILSSSTKQAPVIGEIIDESPASRCAELKVGSEIVMINDRLVTGLIHSDVVEIIKESGSVIKLMIVNCNGPRMNGAGISCDGSSEGCEDGGVCDVMSRCEGGDLFVDGHLTSHYALGNQMFQQQQHNFPDQNRLKSPMMLITSNSSSPALLNFPQQQQQQIHHHIQQQQQIQQHIQHQQQDSEELEVSLVRGQKGYGFSIRGGRDFNNSPMLVCKIVEGGVAEKDARLQVGDEVVSINGVTTQGQSQKEAIAAIQAAVKNLILKVRRFDATDVIEDL